MLVNIECPVEVLDYQLYKSKSSGKTYLSLTFNNLSAKRVKGLKATIYCFDQFGDPIHSAEENYFESKIQFKDVTSLTDPFDTDEKIALDNFPNTRKIEVDITKVLFEDQTIWEKDETITERIKLKEIDKPDQLLFVKKNIGEHAKYFAQNFEEKWSCVCGRLNYDYMQTCKRCNAVKEEILSIYTSEETLNQTIEVYEKELKEKEQEELKYQQEIEKKKKQKVMKYASFSGPVLLIFGIAIFGFLSSFTFSWEKYQLLKDKDNALVESVKAENRDNVEFLLDNGANVDFENTNGENALIEAVKLGNVSLATLLLEENSNDKLISSNGDTLVHIAVKNEQIEILKVLRDFEFDMNATNEDGESVLFSAIELGNADIINYLIKEAGVNVRKVDSNHNNVIQAALLHQTENTQLISELLELDIDLKKKNMDSQNTYESVIISQNSALVKKLIEKDMDINEIDEEGNNALHILFNSGFVDINFLKALIQQGVNINEFNDEGYSPLYIAIQNNKAEAIEELLKHEVNVNKVTKDGMSAIEVGRGKQEIEEVLSQHSAHTEREDEVKQVAEAEDIVISYHIDETGFVSIQPDIETLHLNMNQKIRLKPVIKGDASERVLLDGTLLDVIDEQTFKPISKGVGDLSILPNEDWDIAKIYKVIIE